MTILFTILRLIFIARCSMKFVLSISLFLSFISNAQLTIEETAIVSKLNFTNTIPAELLSARCIVLYQNTFTNTELEETQTYFQQTGIDAVAYFDIARVLAGYDLRKAFSSYFTSRTIKYLILLQKNEKGFQYIFCPYSGNKELIDKTNACWKQESATLNELLRTIYRFSVSNLKKQNFLINDIPEMDISIKVFTGRIDEKFSEEVKIFKTAIPKFGNAQEDAELEAYLKQNFPVKYELVDAPIDEAALFSKGFRTILRSVHVHGKLAKDILGYDATQVARSLATTVYVNNEAQIKTIPADQPIYKFYFRSIEYGNIFLGKKWDADIRWQDALRNHIQALKIDLKIN